MPQQRLAGRNRHDIEAAEINIATLAQPNAPGQLGVQGQLPFSGVSQDGMCAHGQIAIYSVPHSICPVNHGSQGADYHQRIEMFQIIAGNRK
ncbi:hypothetical protein [Mesorhizobium sp.]|uniref:hypothetical protein n=1 Tax=Mesorhizobium sp. TaxID=1871066 RepID=UPI00257DF09A|nr:hypothetical protein [Mesorhizobium sp.]